MYCSNACRQAAYRQRHQPDDTPDDGMVTLTLTMPAGTLFAKSLAAQAATAAQAMLADAETAGG